MKKGRVVKVEGGIEAERLKKLIDSYENADNIAEFSLGTNPYIIPDGDINRNDKKKLGTVHIAVGDNTSYPGGKTTAPVHLDGVISKPTLFVGKKKIMENGNLLV